MKKPLLALLVILLMGGVGFATGWFLLRGTDPEQAANSAEGRKQAVLYKMPLGKFTFQVLQPTRILHIVIDMDVFISDATAFERLGSAAGRARLRDATITAASDLAETMLWVGKGEEENLDTAAMAGRIVLKLHGSFPSVHSAQINHFLAAGTPRS
ncbi:flagellar biosynthesis protein FlgH [Antarcticimicrobium sediminis]|uniref:Flagellar biosynthesis protein FlgH n=1 Tax=Antarcticimicrobium sediminis TaxID=2546227 RepID=A0A4R5EV84_9RHOB|nr:flagellar biosynthesis protein FlgH [Antarcticimicrobium sediminis]TDE38878.1 flagellar biosynthesis protein FlgH [Antarcticimicrobium sediminis]